MIKDSYKKQWSYVLVYKLDRFSRDKYATAIYKKTLKDNGVKVLSCMENIPDSPEGIILESLLEGMNQYYSAELSQKVKRGMKELRLKGNWQGGKIPYGYKVKNKKIVIEELEAENVKFIYSQYSMGVYSKEIIEMLSAKNQFYNGKVFTRSHIYSILHNHKYVGWYKMGEEVISNTYPQIVSEELFEKVNKITEKNQQRPKSKKTVFLLRSKLFCGYCGLPINGESGTSQNGNVKHYYKCRGRKLHLTDCKKSVIQKELLEKIILDAIIKELDKSEIIDKIVKMILQLQEQKNAESTSLDLLLKEKAKIETSLSNLVGAIEKGIIFDTTAKRIKELESRQKEIEIKITKEKSKKTLKLSRRNITTYFAEALTLSPDLLINYLVKKIVLFDDKIQIYFNLPIKDKSPDDNSQGLLFYTKEIVLYEKTSVIYYCF